MLSEFYKNNTNDQIWWKDDLDNIGEFIFSFDKKKTYNLFKDYPQNLTEEEKIIFDNENPYWKQFFEGKK